MSEGSGTIPAKRFGNIVRELPAKSEIEIKIGDKAHIDVRSGKSHFVLMGTPKEDYPALPNFMKEKAWTAKTKLFQDMVKKTIFATSTEETRYILNGIYLIVSQEELKLISTDGRRLAYIVRKCLEGSGAGGAKRSVSAVMPAKTINELLKIISIEEADSIKFNISENQIAFQVKDIAIISRLIEGNFPNYQQVIPAKNKVQAKINTAELLSATRQMALLTAEKGSGVKFSFNKKFLRLSTSTQGLGSGEVDIDIDLAGENIEVAFNPNYVIDILKNLTEEQIIFELNGPLDAVVIKPDGDEQYLCVIMPMRLT
jgi:DNA polymerase-3 subunit beta